MAERARPDSGGNGMARQAERPLRVHRVIARLNVGGPAMHVVNLTRDLNALPDFETTLLAGRVGEHEGDMGYYARERGVDPTLVGSLGREPGLFGDLRALLELVRIFRRDRPDIVHTHTAKAGTLGRLAARIAGVPVVVHTFHGHVLGGQYFSAPVTRAYRFVERQMARLSDRLVVLTEGQARELAELGIAERERFEVIPLGLELARFRDGAHGAGDSSSRARIRAELGTSGETIVIGIVSRLVPIKNHELLLEAFAGLVGEGRRGSAESASSAPSGPGPTIPDSMLPQLWVVGSGECEKRLRARADRLGIAGRIQWLGWRTDLADLYPAMDVVTLVSHDEGTPVALLEATAAGTPVVATEVGGVGEVLRSLGLEAGLVPPSRPDLLAGTLRQFISGAVGVAGTSEVNGVTGGAGVVTADDAGGRHRVPAGTRAAVVRRWAPERLATDLASLYRRLCGRTGGGEDEHGGADRGGTRGATMHASDGTTPPAPDTARDHEADR